MGGMSASSKPKLINARGSIFKTCVLCAPLSESDLANLGQLYRDERLKQKAESMRLDNCEKLHRLVVRQRGK